MKRMMQAALALGALSMLGPVEVAPAPHEEIKRMKPRPSKPASVAAPLKPQVGEPEVMSRQRRRWLERKGFDVARILKSGGRS